MHYNHPPTDLPSRVKECWRKPAISAKCGHWWPDHHEVEQWTAFKFHSRRKNTISYHDQVMKMETNESGDTKENWSSPASPIGLLQQFSQGAVNMALQSAYPGSLVMHTPVLEELPRDRRTCNEAVSSSHRSRDSSNKFQKLKSQMQKAVHWGSHSFRRGNQISPFDPEILANQKRQWYQLQSKAMDPEKYKEPTSLFEHFVIAGLPPDAKLDAIEDAFVRKKKWEQEINRIQVLDAKLPLPRRPTFPALEPQVLFAYPPGKKLALRLKDLAAFCFPGGVEARVPERTPSLNNLNALVYGQEHLSRDDLSFIFSLKVADNATLYGVCLHVQEVVQRAPTMCGASPLLSQSRSGYSRFVVSAPRCYCILTRVPFFGLHYKLLNSIIAQERLNRITDFVTKVALADTVVSPCKSKDELHEKSCSPHDESTTDWMASAIPVDSAIALAATAVDIVADEEASCSCEYSDSPRSYTVSGTSDNCQTRDESTSNDSRSRPSKNRTNLAHNPKAKPCTCQKSLSLEDVRSFESLFSPARIDGDAEIFYNYDEELRGGKIMEWARDSKNELIQILYHYLCMPLPERGSGFVFQPDVEHLPSIEYCRPPVSALCLPQKYFVPLQTMSKKASHVKLVKLKLAAAEEALSLSLWSTATICRVLSLETILGLLTGVLLEKQVVVVCPNLGVLSAVVLSTIPIIRPFEWQSLFLPILPEMMMDFVDAPVPFILGLKNKPVERKKRTSNLVRVNVIKDQAKGCNLPQLPGRKKLMSELRPLHSLLSCEEAVSERHPVYTCTQRQAAAADEFLQVMRNYTESLCYDLRLHSITCVQNNNDRVSILLKDSFIDSFPARDQPFIQLFVETQLFSVLSDFRLATFENENQDESEICTGDGQVQS